MTESPTAEPSPATAATLPQSPRKKPLLRNIAIVVGSVGLLPIFLVSCALSAGDTVSSPPEPTATVEPENAVPEPSFAPEPEPAESDVNLAFGDALTYFDGASISVSKPVEYNPGEYAAGADQKYNIKINITITNGTDANLEPMPYGQMSSGGVEGSQIFDDALGSSPTTVILPGKTITWSEAWSITDPADIVYQIAPNWDYEDAVYVLQK